MTNNSVNEKTFTLILNRTRTFTLRIVNFFVNASLRILIYISTINIETITSQRIRSISSILIPKILMVTVSQLLNRAITNLSVKTVWLVMILKTINRETSNIIFHIQFTTIIKRLVRNLVSMTGGFIHMTLSAVVAVLIHLTTLDPQLLSDLDSQTLAQLDHS